MRQKTHAHTPFVNGLTGAHRLLEQIFRMYLPDTVLTSDSRQIKKNWYDHCWVTRECDRYAFPGRTFKVIHEFFFNIDTYTSREFDTKKHCCPINTINL